jgi:hypothetical protein
MGVVWVARRAAAFASAGFVVEARQFAAEPVELVLAALVELVLAEPVAQVLVDPVGLIWVDFLEQVWSIARVRALPEAAVWDVLRVGVGWDAAVAAVLDLLV